MRELKVVGLDADGKHIICEGRQPGRQVQPAGRRPAARRRARRPVPPEQPQLDIEVTNMLSPKEIQARIRAGASVEQVAAASGIGHRADRAVRPPGAAGTLPRRRAGNRRTPGPRRRTRGDDAAGDRHRGAGRARPQPRATQLGRLAQRGRPLDRAAGLAGRPVRQRRALPLHPGRARRHGHRDRRRGQRADRPGLQAPAAAGRAGAHLDFEEQARSRSAAPPAQPATARRASRASRAGRRGQAGRPGLGGRAARGALQRPALHLSTASGDASSATQPPATPTPAPSTNQRSTGCGASPTASAPVRRPPPD